MTYQCCSILVVISTKCPSAIQSSSEGVVDVTLHVLSKHHKNIDICGAILMILSACAFEEKHVIFLLTQHLKEFQFMCQSISMFQVALRLSTRLSTNLSFSPPSESWRSGCDRGRALDHQKVYALRLYDRVEPSCRL
jgi:hypothetical protein